MFLADIAHHEIRISGALSQGYKENSIGAFVSERFSGCVGIIARRWKVPTSHWHRMTRPTVRNPGTRKTDQVGEETGHFVWNHRFLFNAVTLFVRKAEVQRVQVPFAGFIRVAWRMGAATTPYICLFGRRIAQNALPLQVIWVIRRDVRPRSEWAQIRRIATRVMRRATVWVANV
jgi:hypothetical protein